MPASLALSLLGALVAVARVRGRVAEVLPGCRASPRGRDHEALPTVHGPEIAALQTVREGYMTGNVSATSTVAPPASTGQPLARPTAASRSAARRME